MADNFKLAAVITAVDKLTPTLKNIQRSVKLTSKTIKDIGRAGSSLMASVGIPAGLAFGAVAYGAINAARASIEFASSIQDASDRTGASIESYQYLVNMLGMVGGGAEDADMAFKTFNKGMAEASAGADKNFAGLMRKLKIPLKDSHGQIRGLIDTLPELADGFARNTNPALRSRMALELFGKSGLKMIPILAKGRDGVREWIAEQERLGMIVSAESVSAMDDLGDSIDGVKTQLRSQLTTAMAKLVPVIKPIIDSISEWAAANKELIQAKVVEVVEKIANFVKQTDWKQVGSDISDVMSSIGNVIQMMGGIKGVMIGIGVAFAAGPISSILSIVGAVWRFGAGLLALVGGWSAVGTAMMAIGKIFLVIGRLFLLNPIGLAVTAIAGAAYLVYDNWDKIKGWFVDFFNWLPEKIRAIAGLFKGLVPDWISKGLDGGVSGQQPAQMPIARSGVSGQQPYQTPLARSGALGMATGRQQLTGAINLRFENAPPGFRVGEAKTNQSALAFNPDVGYRTLGAGL